MAIRNRKSSLLNRLFGCDVNRVQDNRSDVIRCSSTGENQIRWRYRGELYSVEMRHTTVMFNSSDMICVYSEDDETVTVFSPKADKLLTVNLSDGSWEGAEEALADRISFDFVVADKLYWFCAGVLCSLLLGNQCMINFSADGSCVLVGGSGRAKCADRHGRIIAELCDGKLLFGNTEKSDNVVYIKLIPQYNLLAAFCDSRSRGFSDKLRLYNPSGSLAADYTASELGCECFYCVETDIVKYPCMALCRRLPALPLDYNTNSGCSVIYNDCNTYWYDLRYSGGTLSYRFNEGMTQQLIAFNDIACR